MIITDVYLSPESSAALRGERGRLPGIEYAARFGRRAALKHGWRDWLAGHLGREDLAGLAPARISAAVLAAGTGSEWIATPLHLSAALTRVHLDHRGQLRLAPPQQAALAQSFARAFAGSGLTLLPLPCGEFLLRAPGIAALPTPEPARFAGAEVPPLLAPIAQGAALRRTASEIEMWLHAESGGAARLPAQEPSVNALWLWGASGAAGEPTPHPGAVAVPGFGADAFLDGLWRLQGAQCRPVPGSLGAVLAAAAPRTVLALSVSAQLREAASGTFTEALAALDARFITPALAALGQGTLTSVTLIVNDIALSVRRGSGLKLWRRPRTGLAGLA
jgi:hypothetical protein